MAKTALESPSKIQRIQVLTTERPVDSSAAKALDRSPPHSIQSIDVEEIMMQREGDSGVDFANLADERRYNVGRRNREIIRLESWNISSCPNQGIFMPIPKFEAYWQLLSQTNSSGSSNFGFFCIGLFLALTRAAAVVSPSMEFTNEVRGAVRSRRS